MKEVEQRNQTLHQQLISKQKLIQSQEQETSFMQIKTEDGVENPGGIEMVVMKPELSVLGQDLMQPDIPAQVQDLRNIRDLFVRYSLMGFIVFLK